MVVRVRADQVWVVEPGEKGRVERRRVRAWRERVVRVRDRQ